MLDPVPYGCFSHIQDTVLSLFCDSILTMEEEKTSDTSYYSGSSSCDSFSFALLNASEQSSEPEILSLALPHLTCNGGIPDRDIKPWDHVTIKEKPRMKLKPSSLVRVKKSRPSSSVARFLQEPPQRLSSSWHSLNEASKFKSAEDSASSGSYTPDFEFRHSDDPSSYMEQYRKKHTAVLGNRLDLNSPMPPVRQLSYVG